HHPVIGSHTDLDNAAVSDVIDFFDGFYFPANASLAIAGDFDPGEARELVKKYFGSIPRREKITRDKPAPPTIEGVLRKTLTDAVELPLACFVWHAPAFYSEGDADMDIIANALAGGKSSRLYRRLVYDKKLAQDVSAYQSSSLLGSKFIIQVFALPGADTKENLERLGTIEREVDAVVAELQEGGVTGREIGRARNSTESAFWSDLESLEEKADLLNRYLFHFGNPGAIELDLGRYSKITGYSTSSWAKKVLKPNGRLILHVLPEEKKGGQQ
ncbi:MAG: peptidase M16, partial [Chloroflexi bacterium]|nr:peptidase M16 [Chloroflexota bacterium]